MKIPGLVKLHTIMIISPLEDDGTDSVGLAPGNSQSSHLSGKAHVKGEGMPYFKTYIQLDSSLSERFSIF